MANIKITDLTAYTDAASTDVLPIVDVGADVTKKITIGNVVKAVPLGTAALPGLAFDGDPNTGIYSPGADQVAISTNGTGRLFVDASGKVGIGTASPGGLLDVTEDLNTGGASDNANVYIESVNRNANLHLTGNASNTATIYLGDQANALAGRIVYQNSNDSLYFGTNNSAQHVTIDSSGRLLVGTTSTSATATALLQGNSNSSTNAAALSLCRGSVPSSTAGLGSVAFSDSGHAPAAYVTGVRDGGTWTSGVSQPSALTFSTTADGASSPTERMRVTNGGRIDLWGGSTVNTINCVTPAAAGTTYYLMYGGHSSSGVGNYGTQSFGVWSNGDVINTNNSYGAISDAKLKENIVDANSQWDDIKALQVRNYNFKEGQTHTQIGLIAQEVELISPGLVSESPDRDAEGNDLGTVTKSVNYSVLYMKAVKALQEAMERIETLEAKVATLEAG